MVSLFWKLGRVHLFKSSIFMKIILFYVYNTLHLKLFGQTQW